MMSALGGGGGSPRSLQKEENQLISVRDKGPKILKNVDVICACPLKPLCRSARQQRVMRALEEM